MMYQYVWIILFSLLIINSGIFIFVLGKKMTMNAINKKKTVIREAYEDKFVYFLTSEDNQIALNPKTLLEKKVYQALIVDYNAYISNSKRALLIDNIGVQAPLSKVQMYLSSRNIWKQKTGTYLAGEYGFISLSPLLLNQLDTSDKELLFVTSKSLIKLSGKKHLMDILVEASREKRLSKNQILSLLELVEEDISGILGMVMASDDLFLKAIALEELGKRQYQESIEWIRKEIKHPQKELRIAALKSSIKLGNIGDNEYLKDILSVVNDHEWEVRAFLAKFLGKLSTELSISILIKYMSDENWYVRHNAGESLYSLNENGKIALESLLVSEDAFARDGANAILQRDALNN